MSERSECKRKRARRKRERKGRFGSLNAEETTEIDISRKESAERKHEGERV